MPIHDLELNPERRRHLIKTADMVLELLHEHCFDQLEGYFVIAGIMKLFADRYKIDGLDIKPTKEIVQSSTAIEPEV